MIAHDCPASCQNKLHSEHELALSGNACMTRCHSCDLCWVVAVVAAVVEEMQQRTELTVSTLCHPSLLHTYKTPETAIR